MKSLELALRAGRARQSPQTGFVHHSYENLERSAETIPVYENFCFALALFRTKTVENVLEAKTLLERLFAFQTAEGFPLFLHDYPQVKSRKLEKKLSIVAQFLLRDFSAVLGDGLRSQLEGLVRPVEQAEEMVDLLIQSQLTGEDVTAATKWWDNDALCFTGPQKQERGEPAITLYDLILGEWSGKMSAHTIRDHPVHLQAGLIYPNQVPLSKPTPMWSRRFWGTGNPTHSAVLATSGQLIEQEALFIDLPEKEVHDEIEVSYFVNRVAGAEFLVSGLQSTTFQLGEKITVNSGGHRFEMTFTLESGEGKFWGHLHVGNRPGQLSREKFEAYDRTIFLRTIERTKAARIKITFRL